MGKTDTTSAAGSSPAAEQDMTEAINAAVEEALRAQAEENEKKMAEALEKQAEENEKKVKEAVEAALTEQKVVMDSGSNTKERVAANEPKMAKIKISRERKDQGDVEVSVNGRVWQIKRNVEVEVPEYVAEVLENTKKMDELRMERIESATKNFS